MRKKVKKLNNHGFSLVEILIAMAILGVVSLTIYSFMMQGSRFYGKQYADADIQSEAQLVANTISDLIVDCEVNISYDNSISNSINPDVSSNVIYAQGKALEISNRDYQFIIFHNDTNLFYLERRPSPSDPSVYEAYDIDNAELLAENITAFDVDLSRVSGKGKGKNIVTFTMTYESTGRSYSGNYQVNLRNNISVSGNALTPVDKDANCTALVVTPNPYYVDVRGKNAPAFYLQGTSVLSNNKDFIANSDVVNAGRANIYEWRVRDKDVNEVDYASTTGAADEKIYHAVFNHPESVPSHIQITATSTIPNKAYATPTYPSDSAIVYFRKILDMRIAAQAGVDEDKVDPLGTATFRPQYTQYNLGVEDLRCSWVLEYKVGSGEYRVCNDAEYATMTLLDMAYSTNLKTRVATSVAVKLGEKATSDVKFRLTAVNSYDSTFDDQYEFGVKKGVEVPGVNAPSRGVEIDLEAFFKSPEGAQYWGTPPFTDDVEITHAYIKNSDSYDAASGLYGVIAKDGKWYVYLDFDAWAHPSDWLGYYNSHGVEMVVDVRTKSGQGYWDSGTSNSKQNMTINWQTKAVELTSGVPLANANVVIPKGSSYDVAAKLIGYNLTKKNLIGIYLQGMNVNSHEVGMIEFNPYISVEYTGGLGNRYVLVEDVKYRLKANTTDDYPTEAIKVMTTLEPMYNLAKSEEKSDYMNRSSFTYNVYVANVEGTGAYIQGPPSVSDLSKWTVITADMQNGKRIPIDEIKGTGSYTVNITAPTQATVTFDAVENSSGQISYFTMIYNGIEYYWNSTYNCWRQVS